MTYGPPVSPMPRGPKPSVNSIMNQERHWSLLIDLEEGPDGALAGAVVKIRPPLTPEARTGPLAGDPVHGMWDFDPPTGGDSRKA
jgi:hypothetical protein